MMKRAQITSAEAPEGGNLPVRIWRGPGLLYRVFRTLTSGLLALCHLGVAQATQATPPNTNASEINKAANLSSDERQQKKKSHLSALEKILFPTLSPNGRWVVYTVTSPNGGADLVAQSTNDTRVWRVSRGEVPPHPSRSTFTYGREPAQVTADSRFTIFTMAVPSEGSTRALGILNLEEGNITIASRIREFGVPRESGRYVAYIRENDGVLATKEELGSAPTSEDEPQTRAGILVVHDLMAATKIEIPGIVSFVFDARGRYLAYIQHRSSAASNGVYIYRLADRESAPVETGSDRYQQMAFSPSGNELAFLSGRRENDKSMQHFSIHYTSSFAKGVRPLVKRVDLSSNVSVSPVAAVQFSQRGDTLVFNVEPVVPEAARDQVGGTRFDLWHWKDPWVQSRQKLAAATLYPRSYRAVYHIPSQRFVQLGTPRIPHVILSDDADYAIGIDQSSYQVRETWGEFLADIYQIDVTSGVPTLLRRAFHTGEWLPFVPFRMSPTGRYVLYFENRRWFAYDLVRRRVAELTRALLPNSQFDSEFNAGLQPATPVGIAGWLIGDRGVLLYDRHDVWQMDPSGAAPPKCLTKGLGRRMNVIFRIWPHFSFSMTSFEPDPGLSTIDTKNPLLFTAFHRDTMETGLWRGGLSPEGEPEPIVMMDRQLTLVAHAKETEQYLVTRETFAEFPDLWTGRKLDRLHRISHVNSHSGTYARGSVELVSWTSDFGVPLRGLLYKPEGFDGGQHYPMIVHIYSVFSHRLHRFTIPEPQSSAFIHSPDAYLSKEYLVFMPDIQNVTPYPGESALASVVSGVRMLIDRGFVDASRVGLAGHSWGGYQTAYILTQTNMFRCAVQSAGYSNSISAYGSVMPGTGNLSSYLFERGYGSYGGPIWKNLLIYLANSPIVFADRIQAPLLIMHNENDGVVPFSQGIELYSALRRNAKEVYLFNYKKETHDLAQYANRLDWDERMQVFFDHCLKDAPKADWMKHGKSVQR